MDFKVQIAICMGLILLGCSGKTSGDSNLIGGALTPSAIAVDQNQLAAIYDSEMGIIQEFDVSNLVIKRQVEVLNSGTGHSLIMAADGSYIVDLSSKHMAIYPSSGAATISPVQLVGSPISAAYHSASESVVVYDDLASVAMLQMTAGGQNVSSWVGGPLLGESTIRAGDFEASGQLVLSFSNNTMAVASVGNSIANKSWNYVALTPSLTGVNWIATVKGQNNVVMTNSDQGLSLISTVSGAILAQHSSTGLTLLKLSKRKDPHAIYWDTSGALKIVYLNGFAFAERSITISVNHLMLSILDVAGDSWMLMDRLLSANYSKINSANEAKSGRRLLSYRLSDLLAQANQVVPDSAQVSISGNYLFSLFPSKIGYATRVDISSGEKTEIQKFNYEIFRQRSLQ